MAVDFFTDMLILYTAGLSLRSLRTIHHCHRSVRLSFLPTFTQLPIDELIACLSMARSGTFCFLGKLGTHASLRSRLGHCQRTVSCGQRPKAKKPLEKEEGSRKEDKISCRRRRWKRTLPNGRLFAGQPHRNYFVEGLYCEILACGA